MAKMIHKLINEAELFAGLANGDEKAFEIIYHHYNKRLAPFVQKTVKFPEITEEIIQDIFVQLWINRHLLAQVEHPTAYLFNIAKNKTLKYLKKIANDTRLLDRLTSTSPTFSNDTEERVIFRESAEIIELAVAGLPGQRKLIWELSRNEGLSHEEIAERLNISKNTVKNQMVHALKHVRGFLENRASMLSASIFFLLNNR
ncbi:RNA polymerase sigma-70 factor [Pedobacter frigoris]|uniref:RNA polymerase sigma-70 factor n=1 Tax=Pedobacter frigoris TaxID=2571272 RepID=A0A4U1CD27_9SPHI|nr:RNA polymerase sigma-70 factor [Pedobacter frigoris]TKC04212.1 RNA polymerase sigma-70 factor [Pedobacter frigoris]